MIIVLNLQSIKSELKPDGVNQIEMSFTCLSCVQNELYVSKMSTYVPFYINPL
jgi:hypothetical protein